VAISNGSYQPLSRPVFIYVSQKAASRPEVKSFVEYYLNNAGKLSKDVGAVALPDAVYQLTMRRFTNRSLGSVFLGKNTVGVNLETLLK
jgi:phosphate transport system substrate-binding protein